VFVRSKQAIPGLFVRILLPVAAKHPSPPLSMVHKPAWGDISNSIIDTNYMGITLVQEIAVMALPLIFGITLHEVAHGWVASWFGDQTAKLSGRLSFNPIKHIDLVGTILVPLIMLVTTNFIFGWAKPVPVDPRNLHKPKRDMAFVALAGPFANIIMACLWGLLLKLGMWGENSDLWFGKALVYMGTSGIWLNAVLAVLNLIPLPPLDGSKVLMSVLPRKMAYYFSLIEPYSFFILILLLLTNLLGAIIGPAVQVLVYFIYWMLML
jgi:Zn-dependent protease